MAYGSRWLSLDGSPLDFVGFSYFKIVMVFLKLPSTVVPRTR